MIKRVVSAATALLVRLAVGIKTAFLRYRRQIHLAVAACVLALIGYDMQAERPQPTPAPAASAEAAAPAAGSAPPADGAKPAGETSGAASAMTAAAAPTAPPPSFHDPRPLAPASQGESMSAAAPSFRDTRSVTAPSFRDGRAVAVPEPAPAQAPIIPQMPAAPSAATAPAVAETPSTNPPPPAAAPLPTLVALPPAALKVDAGACGAPEVQTEALEGGRMRISINAACRPGEAVQISYGGAEIIRRLDARGTLEYVLDCFAGAAAPAELRFADSLRQSLPIVARDLDAVSKIAIIWRAPVNLDLHVFEYAARFEEPGHIWSRAPSTLTTARGQAAGDKRGHGYLSSADGEDSLGDKVEVYTFLHSDEQTSGAISLALDYETRGELPSGATCGQGALAEVDFQVSMRPRGGQPTRQAGVITRVDCGQRIAREARLNQAALPGLRIRR